MTHAKKLAKKLGNHFTHLRKIAQHPLLVRRLYSDEQVVNMAKRAYSRLGAFQYLSLNIWSCFLATTCCFSCSTTCR